MSTVIDQPAEEVSVATELANRTIGVKFQVTKPGTSARLTKAQIERAAQVFGADPKYVTGTKKLLDTREQHWRKVSGLILKAKGIWKRMTFPYPEALSGDTASKGTRLLDMDRIPELDEALRTKMEEITAAELELEPHWPDMVEASRALLRQLHAEADYPASILGAFRIEWDYVSVQPPDYMKEFPEIYQREQERVAARMEVALQMHEQTLALELQNLVERIFEKMEPGEDGKTKQFTQSSMNSFKSFFENFRQMNLSSNKDLDEVVAQAQQALEGATKDKLNKDVTFRDQVREGFTGIADRLDGMLVDRPTRRVRLRDIEPQPSEQLSLLTDDSDEPAGDAIVPEQFDEPTETPTEMEATDA